MHGHGLRERTGLPMFRRGYERNKTCGSVFAFQSRKKASLPSSKTKVCWRRVVTRFQALSDALLEAVASGHERGEDFSLAYCFSYGEDDGGANGGSDDTLVGEHADVSLVVVEPVSRVAGLEAYDIHTKRWVCVAVCSRKGARRLRGQGPSSEHGAAGSQTPRRLTVGCARVLFRERWKYGAFLRGGAATLCSV